MVHGRIRFSFFRSGWGLLITSVVLFAVIVSVILLVPSRYAIRVAFALLSVGLFLHAIKSWRQAKPGKPDDE